LVWAPTACHAIAYRAAALEIAPRPDELGADAPIGPDLENSTDALATATNPADRLDVGNDEGTGPKLVSGNGEVTTRALKVCGCLRLACLLDTD
jgi:hypothetical protein